MHAWFYRVVYDMHKFIIHMTFDYFRAWLEISTYRTGSYVKEAIWKFLAPQVLIGSYMRVLTVYLYFACTF
jgi:hypothetical protein